MAERYYLLSKDTGDGPHLMGEMTRLAQGEYEFKYLIKGTKFPYWFMQIPRMPEIEKTYKTLEVLHYIIYRVVPESDGWAAEVLMKENGILDFDEWILLELLLEQHSVHMDDSQPLCDSHQLFYFYETIPDNAKRYD